MKTEMSKFFTLNDGRKTKTGKVLSFSPHTRGSTGSYVTGRVQEHEITEVIQLLNDYEKEIRRKEKVMVNFENILDRIDYWRNPR